MDDRDTSMDEGVRALYRGLPADAPPPEFDAAILSAARQEVAVRPKRSWAVPVSLAAVIVLSVAVTLRVEEERPGLEPVPLAKAPTAPLAAAPPAQAQVAVPSAPQAKSAADVVALNPESRRERAPAAEPAPAPAFVPTPSAVASSAGAAADERRRDAAPEQAPAAAPGLSAAAPAARSMVDTAKRSAESAKVAVPPTPEAWLERIAELRAQSRHEEADKSYVEFRMRYPDFVIVPSSQQKIAPPR
jgi:hypothetical protein